MGAVTTGCASGGSSTDGGPPSGAPVEEVVVESRGRSTVGMEDVRVWRDSYAVHAAVPSSRQNVLQVLPAVYRSLEIPLAVHDIEEGVVGNPEWRPRRIAGDRVTDFFRCGSGNSLTSHGGSYVYEISVHTRVSDDGEGGSVVQTRAEATASPRNVTGTRVRCSSRQRLEEMINGAVVGALEEAGSLP